jgi:magnesium-transporting ATPase (P-type)
MRKSPRRARTRLIDLTILLRSAYVGTIVSVGALVWAFHTWMISGWNFGQISVGDPLAYAMGTTVVLAGIMAGQLGNFFSARSGSESAFRLSPFRNRWLFVGILLQVIALLAIVYTPFLQAPFGTAPLSASDWIYLYSLAPVVLLIEEARKAVTNHFRQNRIR